MLLPDRVGVDVGELLIAVARGLAEATAGPAVVSSPRKSVTIRPPGAS